MRFFNTSGPVVPADHYRVPPLAQVDLDDICEPVRNKRYFVAPRAAPDGEDLRSARTRPNAVRLGGCAADVHGTRRPDAARMRNNMHRFHGSLTPDRSLKI